MATVGEVIDAFARQRVPTRRATNVRVSRRRRGQRKLAPSLAGVNEMCSMLFSYDEPIAMIIDGDSVFWLSSDNYSRTTKRHLAELRGVLADMKARCMYTDRATLRLEAGLDPTTGVVLKPYGGARLRQQEERLGTPPSRVEEHQTSAAEGTGVEVVSLANARQQVVPRRTGLELVARDLDEFLTYLDEVGGVDVLILSRDGAIAPSNAGDHVVVHDALAFGEQATRDQHRNVTTVLDHLGFKMTPATAATVERSRGDVVVLAANGDVDAYKEAK